MQSKHIRIHEPCTENWDTMTLVEKGKFCKSCNKVVYDVSSLTDTEIISEYERNNSSMCIRIPIDRLNAKPRITNRFRLMTYLVALTISFWIGIKTLFAKPSISNVRNPNQEEDRRIKLDKLKLSGKVLDSANSNLPLSFAMVKITRNNILLGGAYTNFEGKFTITLSNDSLFEGDTLTIKISLIGYLPFEHEFVAKSQLDSTIYMESGVVNLESIDVVMKKSVMGGMIMGVMRMPIHSTGLGTDQYDTKTYRSEEIVNFNLGRDF